MIAINDIKEIVYDLADKSGHATISPKEFNKYANMANIDEYAYYVEPVKTLYQLGKGMPRIAHGMNKIIDRKLLPFLVFEYTISISSGVFPTPSNLEFIDTITANNKEAKWVPYNLVPKYLDSTIDLPTPECPIYTDLNGSVKVYPDNVESINVTYLKNPVVVNWAYTLTGRTPVYTSTGSVDFEWGETHKMSLVTKILGYIGITIRDLELKQLATAEEQKSN